MRRTILKRTSALCALVLLSGCPAANDPLADVMNVGIDRTATDGALDATSVPWPDGDPAMGDAPRGNPFEDAHPTLADGSTDTMPTMCTGRTGTPGDHVLALTSGSLLRNALVHVPANYDPSRGTTLVLNFHGFSSTALQQSVLTRMNASSDRRGFIVVYPYGVATSWNAGQCCGTAWANSVDDVGFVRELLALVSSQYCVDARRIYATGMSNGGFLSHRLACEMSDQIAAIAPVAGVLGVPRERCRPARAVPVLQFHGTSDPLVPYEGGTPVIPTDLTGVLDFLSVAQTMDHWRGINGCSSTSTIIFASGDARCETWPGCRDGSEVSLCTVARGGHTWPGGVPIPFLGATSNDLNATETMLDFFEAHPLR